ncbi:MAG TPA: dihydrolipoamide acetyltransferase family protein, partial [Mucilaginibacter sp.]|nr:dihydrolipoamide acetyltransferase family protein [Mucilaginibacter sp.]
DENDVVQVGSAIAVIETGGSEEDAETQEEVNESEAVVEQPEEISAPETAEEEETTPEPIPGLDQLKTVSANGHDTDYKSSSRFYSPLVKNIAAQEGISIEELDQIPGTGAEGRLTKDDLLNYLQNPSAVTAQQPAAEPEHEEHKARIEYSSPQAAVKREPAAEPKAAREPEPMPESKPAPAVSVSGSDEIIEMDRMRRLIAEHMVMSKQTSPHVTSFVEADVTNVVLWRDRVKGSFEKREGEKITFTPIFIEAVAKAIKDYPMVNVSVDGNRIIKKSSINIGMATALPSGNLIVPVIKKADQLNLLGITKTVNDLANRARSNKLQPDEVKDGTFTLTNVGSFGNVMGTPIINQPQAAILAVGAIKKKPAVIETSEGDAIAIRHMMFLSLSYDHRVVDGALGGSFLRRIADYLEGWDPERSI